MTGGTFLTMAATSVPLVAVPPPLAVFLEHVHAQAQRRVDDLFRLPAEQAFARLVRRQAAFPLSPLPVLTGHGQYLPTAPLRGDLAAVCCRQLGRRPTAAACLALARPPAMVAPHLLCATRVAVAAAALALCAQAQALERCEAHRRQWAALAQWSDTRYLATFLPFHARAAAADPGGTVAALLARRHACRDALATHGECALQRIGILLRLLLELSAAAAGGRGDGDDDHHHGGDNGNHDAGSHWTCVV